MSLELAERALGFCDGPAQVTVWDERWLVSRYARSAPTQATDVANTQIHVLAWHEGHLGTALTNRADDAALREAWQRASGAARAAAASGGEGDHPGLPEPAAVRRADHGFDAATAKLDPIEAGRALATVFGVCEAAGLEAFGIWTTGDAGTAIASSTGIRLAERVTDAHLKVIARNADGRSGWATGTSVVAADLDAEAIARRAAAKVLPGTAAELAPGEYPVVLEAPALGALLSFLGDLAFNGLSHAEGRGALSGRLGTRVTAPSINLSDSPRFARTLPRAFDAEGVPKAPLPLIQDGVAHRVCHDTRSAAVAGGGATSTGHAYAPGGDPDGAVPTNLVMVGGGAADEAELCRPVERGIYVTRTWYVNTVRERETLVTGVTRDGTFLIENGEITAPLRDVRFTTSILDLLENTEALTATTTLESEVELYGRRFATGVVCPSIRAGGFRVTGVTPG